MTNSVIGSTPRDPILVPKTDMIQEVHTYAQANHEFIYHKTHRNKPKIRKNGNFKTF